MNLFTDIIKSNRAWLCLDCGKCSSVCPVTIHLVDGYTSPRLLIENAIASDQAWQHGLWAGQAYP